MERAMVTAYSCELPPMNKAEAFILDEFSTSRGRANHCFEASLWHNNGEAETITVEDLQWATADRIAERVLLEAFKETSETECLDFIGLIQVAGRKVLTESFTFVIAEHLQRSGEIPDDVQLDMKVVQEIVQREFLEVASYLEDEQGRQ
jgi:hypothetical protein